MSRAPGQLGGFPGQPVLYGLQAIRKFGSLCDTHGVSSSILAFHHLIRELVVGTNDGSNLDSVLAIPHINTEHSSDCLVFWLTWASLMLLCGYSETYTYVRGAPSMTDGCCTRTAAPGRVVRLRILYSMP